MRRLVRDGDRRDANGNPVTGLAHRTIRHRDGADLTPESVGFPTEGSYVVLDDNNLRDLDAEGTQLDITIGAASFIATGTGGGCHIDYAGPRELSLP